MKQSIRRRLFRGIAAVSLFLSALVSLATWLAYEDMEEAMLELIFAEEEAFFLSHLDRRNGEAIVGENLVAAFVPQGAAQPPPALFAGLPTPHRGELHRSGRSYMVHVEQVAGGTLYLAKDITPFERREWLFRGVLAVIALSAFALGLALAGLTARRIAAPMSRLAAAVRGLVPGATRAADAGFPTDFEEAELGDIALALARFLDELEALLRRERRLLGMASHEFRTPVAVIAGALDVIDRNGETDATARQRALARIRVAAEEMREQLAAILALSRAGTGGATGRIDMRDVLGQVVDDLAAADLPAGRMAWAPPPAPVEVVADPALAKMLVRNLVHNALQHTGGAVALALDEGGFSVRDHGEGFPENRRVLLAAGGKSQSAQDGALGLYLVTLIAERLCWRLDAAPAADGGTLVSIAWKS